MRGIAGLFHFDRTPVPPEKIRRMIETMAICATDRVTHWTGSNSGVGHLLKESAPEDRYEVQPLLSPGGRAVLVTDALLGNRDELATALGWRSREYATQPDSALVLAAWERWGDDCPRHLDGRFAFAVWEPHRQRLFCAVDHLNFRPIYWWRSGPVFAFASTLRGLFSLPAVSRELDETAFAESFAGFRRTSESTLYRDIRRILPGHTLTVGLHRLETRRYWQLSPGPELRLRSQAEYGEAFQAEFARAVRVGLRTSRNVGVLLSGGLDSSAVAAVAGGILANGGRRLQVLHHLPAGAARYSMAAGHVLDESAWAEALRRFLPEADFHFATRQWLPAPEDSREQEFADGCVPVGGATVLQEDPAWNDLLDRLDLGVMLNGLGGNYLISIEARPARYFSHLAARGRWLALLREWRGHHRTYGVPWRPLVRETWHGLALDQKTSADLPLRFRLLDRDLARRTGIAGRWLDFLAERDRLIRHDFRAALAWVIREIIPQNLGVAPPVIGREQCIRSYSPMLDRRLNEFCLNVPPDVQIRDGWDRRLLREATAGLLPDTVRWRTSRGVPQPGFQHAFPAVKASLCETVARLSERHTGWFDPAAIAWLLRKTSSGSGTFEAEDILVQVNTWLRFFATVSAP